MKKNLTFFAIVLALFLSGCSLLETTPKSCWMEMDGGQRCYYNEEGNPVTGWQHINGAQYHFDEMGVLSTGWQEIDGDIFCFQADGTPVTGWEERQGTTCYLSQDGKLTTGWAEVEGHTRYFREDGSLATGWTDVAGSTYYLDEDGCPVTGLVNLNEGEYRFREDGTLVTGWYDAQDGRLYYAPDGTLATGLTEIDGVTYRFREDGTLVTGWYQEGEYRYYYLEDGTPAQEEVVIDGQTWHFTPEGIQIYLVNPWHYLPEDYTVELALSSGGCMISQTCLEALDQMLADCRAAGLYPVLCSGYRSYWDQRSMYLSMIQDVGNAATAQTIVAIPNTSEHQLGLAVDIVSSNNQTLNRSQGETAVQKWLMEHCWDYGFILRYLDGSTDITGIIYEPWHYRYVGIPVAKAMQENGLTLEEYLGSSQETE